MSNFVAVQSGTTPKQMLDMARAVNAALRGDCANTGVLTVGAGATSATVRDERCRAGRLALLVPLDADAAAVRWHLAVMERGSMTFSFDSAPGPCRFGWIIAGTDAEKGETSG